MRVGPDAIEADPPIPDLNPSWRFYRPAPEAESDRDSKSSEPYQDLETDVPGREEDRMLARALPPGQPSRDDGPGPFRDASTDHSEPSVAERADPDATVIEIPAVNGNTTWEEGPQ
jgi:hypothetical protein